MDDVAALLATAEGQTGLHDFGSDSFREGLERLVHSVRNESALGEVGQLGLQAVLVHLLGQRLQVEDWYRRHPEIENEVIEKPLIGLGLPRTGSTALSFLLAEDRVSTSSRGTSRPTPTFPPTRSGSCIRQTSPPPISTSGAS